MLPPTVGSVLQVMKQTAKYNTGPHYKGSPCLLRSAKEVSVACQEANCWPHELLSIWAAQLACSAYSNL